MPVRPPFSAGAAEPLAPFLAPMKAQAVYPRFQGVWLRATLPWSAPQMAPALGWQRHSGRAVALRLGPRRRQRKKN